MKEGKVEGGFYDPAIETMHLKQKETYFNEGLQHIVRHAYEKAPAFRDRLNRAAVDPSSIRTVGDLEKVPIIRKEDLLNLQKINPPFGGLATLAPEEMERISCSPGPLYDPGGAGFQIGIVKALCAAGIGKGDIVLNPMSYHLVPAGLLFHEALKHLGAVVIHTGPGNSELQLKIMHDLGVTGFLGNPSFLMILLEQAERLGYNFRRDFALRHAAVAGEMLTQSMREHLERGYGISTTQFYGIAEIGATAYECKQKSGMHIVEEIITEIVDPTTGKQLGPGEVGEIVLTPFREEVYPIIRYGTGDLSVYTDEPCSCGRTSHRLVRILGRTGGAVRVRGLFLVPVQIEEVISRFPQISRAQAIISRREYRDEVVLKSELKDETIDRQKLSDGLLKCFGDICRVKLDRIEFVSKGVIPQECKTIEDLRTWD